MHEYSVVQALMDQCADYLQQHQASQIDKLVVQIGELSGVEPALFARAFDTFKLSEPWCADAELVVQIQPIILQCDDCGYQGEAKPHDYRCPKCQSGAVRITEGEDLLLMQLEMR